MMKIQFVYLAIFSFWLFHLAAKCQTMTKSNCTIFIDGKLTENVDVKIVSNRQNDTFATNYTIGELSVLHSEIKLDELDSNLELIIRHFPNGTKNGIMFYKTFIRSDWLKNRYLIFNITNFKKPPYYWVSFYTPGHYSKRHKKECEIFLKEK